MDDRMQAEIKGHWLQLRGMTYDLLDAITDQDLSLRLNFPESQALGYQFWCMLGTQESWIALLESGQWDSWGCSLDGVEGPVTRQRIKTHLQAADEKLFGVLARSDLLATYASGGTPLMNYLLLVEHESHHQGQLINFMYAHHLPIPKSWESKWALSRDD